MVTLMAFRMSLSSEEVYQETTLSEGVCVKRGTSLGAIGPFPPDSSLGLRDFHFQFTLEFSIKVLADRRPFLPFYFAVPA